MKRLFAAAMTFAVAIPAAAQVAAGRTPAGCIDLSRADAKVSATGRLNERSFTDPYGTEVGFLIDLPSPDCADDGGDYADATEKFTQVQVASVDPRIHKALKRAAGSKVTVSGTALAAHTRHHRRPVVVMVDQLKVR